MLLQACSIYLPIITFDKLKRTDAGEHGKEDAVVVLGKLFVGSLMLAKLHLFECLFEVGEGAVAADALEGGEGCGLDGVGVVKGLNGIRIGTGRHQQVSGVNVDQWILLIADDQLLEVVEGQVVVAEEVGALATEDVGLEESLVEL